MPKLLGSDLCSASTFAFVIFELRFLLNSVFFSSVGTFVWMIDSMHQYVIVNIFLYSGVGTFVWRNVSIFEYFNTQDSQPTFNFECLNYI